MNSSQASQLHEEEINSPLSEEKMDTGSESFLSTQNTPSSILSSDDDKDHNCEESALRLQNLQDINSTTAVLRLSAPVDISSIDISSIKQEITHYNLDSTDVEKFSTSKNFSIGPPKLSSTLTSTTNHPLMGLNSPPDNYPDLIPKKLQKIEDDKDLSFSSMEDDRHANSANYFYPQRNSSKSNLYFSENFVTANSQLLSDIDKPKPPDVTRVEQKLERRKIIPQFIDLTNHTDESKDRTSTTDEDDKLENGDVSQVFTNFTKDLLRSDCQGTPKDRYGGSVNQSHVEEFHTGISQWSAMSVTVPSVRSMDLPIELSSKVLHKGMDSPDVVSTSTQEDRSAYQALLDPYTGHVALRHTPCRNSADQRRKIQLPPDDTCSLDSVSVCSLDSEEEPPLNNEPSSFRDVPSRHSDEEDTKRSTVTGSECSESIPEYSLAEELQHERAWLSVPRAGKPAVCDKKVIEPFKRVVSHGGYHGRSAIIVFSACYLPDNARPDYRYVMDNLFLYVMWSLERLITDEYVLVYLHGSAEKRRLPTFHWLHECYKLIDRRLRKSLKHLYLVHPTIWLKSLVLLTKPFISSKFFHKLSYVKSLEELHRIVNVEPNAIPELVRQYDATKR